MASDTSKQQFSKPPSSFTPGEEQADFFDRQTGPFFRTADWSAFWTVLLIAGAVYIYTLAPTVTLEDSGELAVASDYLGVPHPPGYPIWTLLTWLFQWVFHFVEYNGQPNPAWSVGLFSAVTGALACAVLAMLVSRSGGDMMRTMKKANEELGYSTETLICWTSGVAAGLLYTFSPVLWSQSVIVEVYSLNALFLVLVLLMTYRWMCRPHEDQVLYLTAYLFGLGLTNHQTLLFVGLALLAAIGFRDRVLFRDSFAALCFAIAGGLFFLASQARARAPDSGDMTFVLAVLFLLAPIGIFIYCRRIFTEWRRLLIVVALSALGISFYLYMPFASEQNPPMNWGYPRTAEGLKHAITRGQYEKITPSDIIGDPRTFFAQMKTYFVDLREQFTLPTAMVALLPFPFIFLGMIDRRSRTWLYTVLIAFVSVSFILIVFLNPKFDIQTLFIQRVQLIQSHAVYALWMGYGLVFGLTMLEMWLGGIGIAKVLAVIVAAVMPLTLVYQNYFDEDQIRVVGGAEQNGHDFGWQFGNWQLRGVNGIKEDLQIKHGDDFERIWSAYPNPEFPPEMGTNAVFFGGTDPGRFVPTYMIYSAKVRSDVYLITQNALADNTYMAVMRDLYGDAIWIPSQQDSNIAFQQYVRDVQEGRIPPGAEVTVQDGRVSVQGVAGVMMINGILARMIFEANKGLHPFYVEESYVIPWMYPYLEPHGLILKINPEPIEITPEMVKNDREFWNWYTEYLLSDRRFERDVVARKTFSKLRSAIAGIYNYRRMFDEAEHAFKQSIALYPLSPEANFRLADLYMQYRRFGDARAIMEELLKGDPGNDRVEDFLNQIRGTEQADLRRMELERQFQNGQAGDLNAALELARLYRDLGINDRFVNLTQSILHDTSIPPQVYLQVGQLYADIQRFDLLEYALRRFLEREPGNARVWIDMAAVLGVQNKTAEAMNALRRAVELGGEGARDAVRRDNRFDPLRNLAEFRAIIPPPAAQQGFTLPFQF